MKRLLLFTALVSACGCSLLIRPEVTFVLRNDTSKDLTVSTFFRSKILDRVSIKSNEEYKKRKVYREDGNSDVSPFSVDTDSLVIAFADGRRIIQYCDGENLYFGTSKPDDLNCDPKKNLMNFHNGKLELGKKRKSIRTIVLDKSDYDQAVLP